MRCETHPALLFLVVHCRGRCELMGKWSFSTAHWSSEGGSPNKILRHQLPQSQNSECLRSTLLCAVILWIRIIVHLGLHLIMEAIGVSFTGLFEKHKLLFSFNMTIKIEQADHRVPQEELDFFLKGSQILPRTQCRYSIAGYKSVLLSSQTFCQLSILTFRQSFYLFIGLDFWSLLSIRMETFL